MELETIYILIWFIVIGVAQFVYILTGTNT